MKDDLPEVYAFMMGEMMPYQTGTKTPAYCGQYDNTLFKKVVGETQVLVCLFLAKIRHILTVFCWCQFSFTVALI